MVKEFSKIILCMLIILMSCTKKGTNEKPNPGLVSNDESFFELVPKDAQIEKLAGGMKFIEGPIWHKDGFLLFTDIPANVVYKWEEGKQPVVYRAHSGSALDAPEGAMGPEIGANGLAIDHEGRLILCQHGNRQVIRVENDGTETILAAKYKGKRFNSPNDAIVKSDGSVYFTDPPYGLARQDDTPGKELPYNGVYKISSSGEITLLDSTFTRPNGLAFSVDEKYLYVANSDPEKRIWVRFNVNTDGTLSNKTTFFDATATQGEGLPDGLKLDTNGNLYCTGTGGVWVFSPEGKHLGTIKPEEVPANCAFGGADGKTLFMTARTGLYRIKLNAKGAGVK